MEENLMDGGKSDGGQVDGGQTDGGKSDGWGKIDGWRIKMMEDESDGGQKWWRILHQFGPPISFVLSSGNMQPSWENLLAGWPNMTLQPIVLKIYIMIHGAL